MEKPEALFLAEELEAPLGTVIGAELYRRAAKELRRLHAENAAIAAALAASCDEQRHELWESGGVAGCERARVVERQRDALLEALKKMRNKYGEYACSVCDQADAAIKAVEKTK